MAVETLYHAARDSLEDVMADPKNRIFTSKADADARDRMLAVYEGLMEYLRPKVTSLTEEQLDAVAIAIAEDRDFLARALKKPSEFEGSTESASGE